MVHEAHHGGAMVAPLRHNGHTMATPWFFESTMEAPWLRHGDAIVLRAHYRVTKAVSWGRHGTLSP